MTNSQFEYIIICRLNFFTRNINQPPFFTISTKATPTHRSEIQMRSLSTLLGHEYVVHLL